MIGEEYLEVRAELGTALFALTALAAESKAPPDDLHTLQGLSSGLRDPFLVVVVGEVKAGKSSLLNALFGRDFCRVDVLPATDRIHIFRYGNQVKDVQTSPHTVEMHRPIPFLRDFHIVDTPGTNTIVPEHQAITERFIPMADLVLFVFSITNPWGATAWQMLDLVQKTWLKNVVFVLQQADLREPLEVDLVIQHLRQTAMQKLGRSIPVFAVSAKKALLAKTTGIDKERLWKDSNFKLLESHINDVVTGSDARLGKLQIGCRTAKVILGNLATRVRTSNSVVEHDEAQLRKIQATTQWMQEQTMRQIGGFLRSLEEAYDNAKIQGELALEERLKFWATVGLAFGKNDWMHEFQQKLEASLRESIKSKVEHILQLLETDLKSVHQQLHDALANGFKSVPPAQLDAGLQEFSQARGKLLAKIELTLFEKMATDQIERQLASLFRETATWVRVPVGAAAIGAAAVGGIASGVSSSLAMAAVADVTGVLAACTAVVGTFAAFSKRTKILDTYRTQMSKKRGELVSAIGDHFKNTIELFYQQATRAFQPLEAFCEVERNRFAPLLDRVGQLETTFARISTELKAG